MSPPASDDFIGTGHRSERGNFPGYTNAAPPGGQYLGLGPAGYYLGYEMFGRKREEEAQKKQMEELQKLLQQMRPRTETMSEPILSQERTGRYHVGDPIAPTPPGPTTLSDALTGVTDYPIPGPGYMPPGADITDYPTPGPGYFARPPSAPAPLEYPPEHPMQAYEARARAQQNIPYGPRIDTRPPVAPPLPPEIVTPPQAPAFGGFEPPVAPEPAPVAPPPEAPPLRREPIEARPVLLERGEGGRETETVTRMEPRTRQVPGKPLLDIIAANPQMLQVLKAFPGLLPLIQQEQENQAWATAMGGGQAPATAAPTVGAAPPVATGTAAAEPTEAQPAGPTLREETMLARATARREQLQVGMDRLEADPTGRARNSPRGKAHAEQFQKAVDDERQAAQALRDAQKAQREATKTETPTEFGVDYARAQDELRDELKREPTPAETGKRVREIRDREKEEKPLLIEGQPYRMVRNEQGEPVMQPIAGVPQKAAKPWYEGITRAEAEAMSKDPNIPPERRAQARELADTLQTGAEKVAAAGVVKSTQASLDKETGRFNMLRALTQVEDLAKANPDWIGGSAKPLTAGKYAAAYDAPDKVKGTAAWLAGIPPGYNVFRANLDAFTAEKLHELAGSALTPGEIARYASFLPSVWQSEARFMASVQVGREMMIGANKYHEAREQGKSVKEAQDIARESIESAYQRGVQKYGDPFKSASGGTPVQVPRHGRSLIDRHKGLR